MPRRSEHERDVPFQRGGRARTAQARAALVRDRSGARRRARARAAFVRGRFVELPLGATEERVTGSIELGSALREGRVALAEGLLARAHQGVLYVDEVNLLPDGLVDLLLDAAASGV